VDFFGVSNAPLEGKGEVTRLNAAPFSLPRIQFRLAGTRDGSGIMFVSTTNGVSNLWNQPVQGGPPRRMTNFNSDLIFCFDWSPDGKQLVIARGHQASDVVVISNFR